MKQIWNYFSWQIIFKLWTHYPGSVVPLAMFLAYLPPPRVKKKKKKTCLTLILFYFPPFPKSSLTWLSWARVRLQLGRFCLPSMQQSISFIKQVHAYLNTQVFAVGVGFVWKVPLQKLKWWQHWFQLWWKLYWSGTCWFLIIKILWSQDFDD